MLILLEKYKNNFKNTKPASCFAVLSIRNVQTGPQGGLKLIKTMLRFILLALATSICSIANAQLIKLNSEAPLDKKVLEVSLEGPMLIATDLQNELALTEAQYAEVIKLYEERFRLIAAAESEHKADAPLLSKIIYGINLEADKALEMLLDPLQVRLLAELGGRQTARFTSDNSSE